MPVLLYSYTTWALRKLDGDYIRMLHTFFEQIAAV